MTDRSHLDLLIKSPISLRISIGDKISCVSLTPSSVIEYEDNRDNIVQIRYLGRDDEGGIVVEVLNDGQGSPTYQIWPSQLDRIVKQALYIQLAGGDKIVLRDTEETFSLPAVSIIDFKAPKDVPVLEPFDSTKYGSPRMDPILISVGAQKIQILPGTTMCLRNGDRIQYMCTYRSNGRVAQIIQVAVQLATGQKYIMGISLPHLSLLLNTYGIREA